MPSYSANNVEANPGTHSLSTIDASGDPSRQGGVNQYNDPSNPQMMWLQQRSPGSLKFENGQWWGRRADGSFKPLKADGSAGPANLDQFLNSIFDPNAQYDVWGHENPAFAAQRQRDQQAAQQQSINAQIQKFIDSMTGPIAANDPIRMNLLQAGTDSAQAAMGRAGIGGRSGLGASQAAATTQSGMAQYEAQRAGFRQQGLAALSNRDINLATLQQQAQDAQAAAMQNKAKSIGSLVGGGIGALGFLGGPALGAATMSAGASLGGSWAASNAAPPRYASPSNNGLSGDRNPFTGY